MSATIALTSRIALGARAGRVWGGYGEDPRFRFPDGGGTAATDTVTYYTARRRLERVPVEVLLQYRHPMTRALGVYAEGGAGVMMFTEHQTVSLDSTPLFAIIGYQRSFSFTAGAGVVAGYLPKADLTAGVSFHQAVPSDGDLWSSSDNPKFLSAYFGIRYPRP